MLGGRAAAAAAPPQAGGSFSSPKNGPSAASGSAMKPPVPPLVGRAGLSFAAQMRQSPPYEPSRGGMFASTAAATTAGMDNGSDTTPCLDSARRGAPTDPEAGGSVVATPFPSSRLPDDLGDLTADELADPSLIRARFAEMHRRFLELEQRYDRALETKERQLASLVRALSMSPYDTTGTAWSQAVSHIGYASHAGLAGGHRTTPTKEIGIQASMDARSQARPFSSFSRFSGYPSGSTTPRVTAGQLFPTGGGANNASFGGTPSRYAQPITVAGGVRTAPLFQNQPSPGVRRTVSPSVTQSGRYTATQPGNAPTGQATPGSAARSRTPRTGRVGTTNASH